MHSVNQGGVPEWLIGLVSKTSVAARLPRVRIPPPPQRKNLPHVRQIFLFFITASLTYIVSNGFVRVSNFTISYQGNELNGQ
jgi:hypothetical protein